MLPAENINHLWAGLLIEELVRCGVECFFVAPGSRSTPLVAAVVRHERARSVLHYDERGTAFAALGYGRSTGRPAGWITTSGTAVANGLPAAVEASTDGVPMLLLTADRPPEKRDTGANQTIDQVGIFGSYVRWQFDLPVPTPEIAPEMVLTTASRAVHGTRRFPPGPVHLNCMFRKPLAPVRDGRDYAAYLAGIDDWRNGRQPYTTRSLASPKASGTDLDTLAETFKAKPHGLVVCGRLRTPADARAARRLADVLGWPLVPDAMSRLRFAAGGPTVPYADQVLVSDTFREHHPVEAVLHVGGRSVSKRLRLFLKAQRPVPYVVARPDPRRLDPDHRVTAHIESEVAAFCDALAERAGRRSASEGDWLHRWQQANAAVARVLDETAETSTGLSEPLVARLVSQHRPPGGVLVLGSSMPVRDINRYARARTEGEAAAKGRAGAALPPVFANRGASGIDGTVATAAGVCEGLSGRKDSPEPGPLPEGAEQDPRSVTLVIGDLALLHDQSSLALLDGRPVTTVVVNNGGGGIFHFLPIADHEDVFEPHFTAPHGKSFQEAAAMFGLEYDQPRTPEAFTASYRQASRSGGPALIEVRTDREENHVLHERLEARVAAAVRSGMADPAPRG